MKKKKQIEHIRATKEELAESAKGRELVVADSVALEGSKNPLVGSMCLNSNDIGLLGVALCVAKTVLEHDATKLMGLSQILDTMPISARIKFNELHQKFHDENDKIHGLSGSGIDREDIKRQIDEQLRKNFGFGL